MPDIAMCSNHECPLRENCYRHMAEPNKYGQSYTRFKPNEKGECDYYWPLRSFDEVSSTKIHTDDKI
jgi:hypothetical protein